MAKRGKRYQELVKDFNRRNLLRTSRSAGHSERKANAKFDETVEVAVRLGVDPRHADQQVGENSGSAPRYWTASPSAGFRKRRKAKEAEAAGADFVGAEDLAEKIQGGWTDFDVAVATPDMMGVVGRLGGILGLQRFNAKPQNRHSYNGD